MMESKCDCITLARAAAMGVAGIAILVVVVGYHADRIVEAIQAIPKRSDASQSVSIGYDRERIVREMLERQQEQSSREKDK